MRQIYLSAAVAVFAAALSSNAMANGGSDKCFDKATLTYGDCPSAIDWSGAYLGAHAGYAWGDVEGDFLTINIDDLEVEGFLAGGQVGYQEQLDNDLVVGLELDFSGLWADDSAASSIGVVGANVVTPTPIGVEVDLNWLASARVRVGLAMDEVMPYLTAGVALGDFEADANFGAASTSVEETAFGAVVGGGVETMLDSNWIAGIEGLYYFFDEEKSLTPPGAAGDSIEFGDVFVARARLSYKF